VAAGCLGVILLAPVGASLAAGPEDTPARVSTLLDNGAYDLALALIDRLQPEPLREPEEWVAWERVRLQSYRKREDWDGLLSRTAKIPAGLPLLSQQRLLTEAVELLLPSGRGDAMRGILRELLWRGGGDSVQMSQWRRLVIRSYLAADQVEDARIAIQRYQSEYLPADKDWVYLYGQVLLRSGDADTAAASLAAVQTRDGRLLRTLSRLRAGIDDPELVIEQLGPPRHRPTADDEFLASLWSLYAEAASLAYRARDKVVALEALFSGTFTVARPEFRAWEIGDVWQAYRSLAEEVGNARHLLQGESEAWREVARELGASNYPVESRAVIALLALDERDPMQRDELHTLLFDSLREDGMDVLAVRLYRDPQRFPDVDVVPAAVRHRIVTYAIKHRDIELAALMSRQLPPAGPDQDPLSWALIRARLAIYTGEFRHGEGVLREAIGSVSAFDADAADRIMQLIFDLQSVGRHKAAYLLFEMMHDRVSTSNHKRETLFWMADSLRNMGQYTRAAELYFESALLNGEGFDIWGQTARLNAAEALTEAGMLEDARRIYEQLLRLTADPKQRLALERRLQQLWLRKDERAGAAEAGSAH
jgi:tetratricopeptide (TPR) repeat protein